MQHFKSKNKSKVKSKSPSHKPNLANKSQLRIIGGQYRGRKLTFEASEGLRPTLDQVRETLFNWLSADIHEAKCLDLFAGSGALGFEALSRGATHVTFVDNNPKAILSIKQNLKTLSNDSCECISLNAEIFIESATKQYDLIFLDPPYNLGLLENTLEKVKALLAKDGLIYIEMESSLALDFIEAHWEIVKLKSSSRFCYGLIRQKS